MNQEEEFNTHMKTQNTFNPALFDSLRKAEQRHCWFVVRRSWILDRVKKMLPALQSAFLEIGCGTGNVSSFLAAHGYAVTGCEYFSDALLMSWPGFRKVQGSATALPFKDNHFDAVGLFDILEHFDDDIQVLAEAARVVKKDGLIFVTVPARRDLWSSFDDYSRHKRRYHPEDLKSLFDKAGLTNLSIEYLFLSLYIPAKITRRKPLQDPFRIGVIANFVFRNLFETERHLSRTLPMPLGTSLLGVAKKLLP